MHTLKIHCVENAQPPVNTLLASVENMLSFVPNVFVVIAESAPALKAFIALNEFTRTVVRITHCYGEE